MIYEALITTNYHEITITLILSYTITMKFTNDNDHSIHHHLPTISSPFLANITIN